MAKVVKYRIRNELHEVIAALNSKEIIKKISNGAFTGNEEISAPPYLSWHKLSSHPQFYDAFLGRLYSSEYALKPSDEESKQNEVEGPGEHTKHKDAIDADKTNQSHEPGDPGATVHHSVLRELFGNTQSGRLDRGEKAEHTDPFATDLVEVPRDNSHEPTSITPSEPAPSASKVATGKKAVLSDKRKRTYAIIAAVLVGVVILSQFDSEEQAVTEKKRNQNTTTQGLNELIGSSRNKAEQIKALLAEGDKLYKGAEVAYYRGALSAYREAYSLDTNNPKIAAKLAMTLARLMKLPEGTKYRGEIAALIQQGRGIDPHFTGFYRAEALVHLQDKKADDSLRSVIKAIETDPSSVDSALLLGEVQYFREELQDARKSFVDTLNIDSNNLLARLYLSRIYVRLREFQPAVQQGLEAIRLNPLNPTVYLTLGKAYAALAQVEEASNAFETAGHLVLLSKPHSAAEAYFELGKLREEQGLKKEATQAFALALHYDPEVSSNIGKKIGSTFTSASSRARLAKQNEYDATYFKQQGKELITQRQFQEGVRFYQAAYLMDINSPESLIELGEAAEKIAESAGDYQIIMNLYQRAIIKDPKHPLGYVKLGLIETKQYNLNRAAVLLRRAEALAPADTEVLVALGRHFYQRRDYKKALDYFIEAHRINPLKSEIAYYSGLVRILWKTGDPKEAASLFYKAYTLDPQNYDALVEWLKLKVRSFEKNYAIKFVRNLLDEDPGNPYLYWALGEVYEANQEFRRAIEYYHKALDLNNKLSKIRMSLARSLESLGQRDKATAEYRMASVLDTNNSDGYFKAADLFFQMRDYKTAEKVLKELISATPNYPGAYFLLSKLHKQNRKQDQAVAALEKEVENNPENFDFIIEMAKLYMEYKKYPEAIRELKKVANLPSLKEQPASVNHKITAYFLLARCYRVLERLEAAEAAINLAIKIDPNDPELRRERGYVYYAMQRDEESVADFEYYMNRQPAAEDSKTIKSLIKRMRIEQ